VEDNFYTDGRGRRGSDSLGMNQVHYVYCELYFYWASLVDQLVKNPPAMQDTWIQSLGWEDPLEEGMATDSSILAWRIPWTEEPGRQQSIGSNELDMTEVT